MNAARLLIFFLATVLLGPLPSIDGAMAATPVHLSGGLPWDVSLKVPSGTRYAALLLIPSQECPCHWLETYWAALKAINEDQLALAIKVVISQPKPSEFQHLKDLGVREEHLMADPDGSLAARIGLNEKRFPYILVISMAPDGDVVMALQISGIQGDQQAQGAVLASLRFLFGERP